MVEFVRCFEAGWMAGVCGPLRSGQGWAQDGPLLRPGSTEVGVDPRRGLSASTDQQSER